MKHPGLTPEQQAIVDRWEKEKQERQKCYDLLQIAMDRKDARLWHDIINKIEQITPSVCEHDRSIWSPCAACNEIERIIHPELFCHKCQELLSEDGEPVDTSKTDGMCSYCFEDSKKV